MIISKRYSKAHIILSKLRILIPLVLMLNLFDFIPAATAGSPTVAQECYNGASGVLTSLTCVMSLSVAMGDVLACGTSVGTAVRGTFQDTLNTLFTTRNANATSGGTNNFVAAQVTGTTTQSGLDNITVYFGSSPGAAFIDCVELSGVYEYQIGVTSAIGSATSGGAYSVTLGAPFTPLPNSFVYVYAVSDPCSGTSTITYNSGYTSLAAINAVGADGGTCKVIGSHNFHGAQAAMYEVWGASGTTLATMSWGMNTGITTGTGVWLELVIELSTTPPPTPPNPPPNPIHGSSKLNSGVVFTSASYGNPGLSYNTQQVLQANLNMLYSTGAHCIRVDINYGWWLQSNTTQINELTTVVQGIKSSGHCLILADAGSETYRHGGGLTWTQFKLAWASRVRTLATLFQPTYYEVVKEPGWYCPMISDCYSNPQVQNFTDWDVLTQNLTGTVLSVSPNTQVGVAIGAHSLVANNAAYTIYLQGVVLIPQLTFVGFDIYTAGDQQATTTYLNTYGTGGKQLWIPEWWSTTDGSQSANDPQAITNIFGFAQSIGASMLIPFYTNDFAAYGMSSITNSTTLISTYQNDRTPVFYTYQSLLIAVPSCGSLSTFQQEFGSSMQLFAVGLIVMAAVAILAAFKLKGIAEGGVDGMSEGIDGGDGGGLLMDMTSNITIIALLLVISSFLIYALTGGVNSILSC